MREKATGPSSKTKGLKLRREEDTVAISTMELLELVRNCEGSGDADFLREGVRVLAQALMDAEVSEQIGAGHGERVPDRGSVRSSV